MWTYYAHMLSSLGEKIKLLITVQVPKTEHDVRIFFCNKI